MGFTSVFLIGVDHNFSVRGEPHEKLRLEGADMNHFHPDYFGGQDWHLPDLVTSEEAYSLARDYFNSTGRQIFDATIGGKLDIFPKIEFHKAVELCKTQKTATSTHSLVSEKPL